MDEERQVYADKIEESTIDLLKNHNKEIQFLSEGTLYDLHRRIIDYAEHNDDFKQIAGKIGLHVLCHIVVITILGDLPGRYFVEAIQDKEARDECMERTLKLIKHLFQKHKDIHDRYKEEDKKNGIC